MVERVAEECIKEFAEWLAELPIDEAETAIQGLKDYLEEFKPDILKGWANKVD